MDFEEYITKRNKKYLIFDFDLTIARIDINWANWHPTMATIISKYDSEFEYNDGDKMHHKVNEFIEIYGKPLRDELWNANADYEKDNLSGFTANPELVDFIKKSDVDLYIYSSNSRIAVTKGLSDLGILQKFTKIVTREDVMFIKPNSEGFNKLIDTSMELEKYLMIGDSNSDRLASEAVSMDFYLVDYFSESHD